MRQYTQPPQYNDGQRGSLMTWSLDGPDPPKATVNRRFWPEKRPPGQSLYGKIEKLADCMNLPDSGSGRAHVESAQGPDAFQGGHDP